jgi:hypothetical protein
MNHINETPQICWSVWGDNPTVSWNCHGGSFAITMKYPPLAVIDLSAHSLIAIIGNYDELGSENLLLYSYEGVLTKTLRAPALGSKAHFGRVSEAGNGVTASVGFFDNTGWVEREGYLDLESGNMRDFHRSY